MNKLFSADLNKQLTARKKALKKVPLDEIKITEPFSAVYDEVIIPGVKLPNQLFISDFSGAENKEAIACDNIKTIISVTEDQPKPLNGITYHSHQIKDLPSEDIGSFFPKVVGLIDDGLKMGNVLIHCNMGVS